MNTRMIKSFLAAGLLSALGAASFAQTPDATKPHAASAAASAPHNKDHKGMHGAKHHDGKKAHGHHKASAKHHDAAASGAKASEPAAKKP